MSFLFKRLAKLGEIAAKKDIEQKYNIPQLSSEELNYVRTIPTDQCTTNEKFIEIYNNK
jgi:hypothetical protein